VKALSYEGSVVLDFFAGAVTTGVAMASNAGGVVSVHRHEQKIAVAKAEARDLHRIIEVDAW